MLYSCFASNILIDQQTARPGFCGSGYGTRPRVLVFVGSGYDDPTDSERTPNAPRMGQRFPKISELFSYPDLQKPSSETQGQSVSKGAVFKISNAERTRARTRTEHTVNL